MNRLLLFLLIWLFVLKVSYFSPLLLSVWIPNTFAKFDIFKAQFSRGDITYQTIRIVLENSQETWLIEFIGWMLSEHY